MLLKPSANMTLTPLRKNVLCRKSADPKSTAAGIALPDDVNEYRNHFDVVAVGDEVRDIKPGDKVLLPDAGGAIEVPGNLVLIAEDKVLAVL